MGLKSVSDQKLLMVLNFKLSRFKIDQVHFIRK